MKFFSRLGFAKRLGTAISNPNPSARRPRRRQLRYEALEYRNLLAGDLLITGAPLQNSLIPLDANDDSAVSAIDALIVINQIATALGEGETGPAIPVGTYPDVNGDQSITSVDAQIVIDYLSGTGYPYPQMPGGNCGDTPAPTVTIDSHATDVNEMQVFTLSGTMPNAYGAQVSMGPNWRTVSFVTDNAGFTWSMSGYYDDDEGGPAGESQRSVDVLVLNNCHTAAASTTLTVHNVAPTISVSAPASINEGEQVTLSLAYNDAVSSGLDGIPFMADTLTIVVDWGDGTSDTYSGLGNWFYATWASGQTLTATHVYVDDNPTSTPQDNYLVTATIFDDDTGASTATASITVNNVAPAVTIDSVTVIDKVLATDENGNPTQWLNPGQIDESEGFIVRGTVTDAGVSDTHTAMLKVDLNFDGDTDDAGESVAVAVTPVPNMPGHWTFEHSVAQVLDDGPWLGNATVTDDLNIDVLIEDDDAGAGSAAETALTWDVAPTIIDDPAVPDDQPMASFTFDSQGYMTSATMNGAFDDLGSEDEHTVIIEWGDGQTTTEALTVGDRAFSVTRVFPTNTPLTPDDLEPIIVYVQDDDGLFDVFVQANNDCQNVNLPEYTDKVAAGMPANWNPTGHLTLTWDHFTPLPPALQVLQAKLLAFTRSPFPSHSDIVKRVAVEVEHEGMVPPAGNEDAFNMAADPHWMTLREYKLTNDEAYDKAKEKFVEHTGTERCWITVVKFDPAEIDKIVQITLDQSLPNGTRVHPANKANLANQQNGAAKVEYIRQHEQGHHDISEAYAKVLRAELKSMRFALWSPVPRPQAPDVYRDLAAKLLRKQALPRLAKLDELMNNTQNRYDKQTKHGNLGNPHPGQVIWDQALAQALGNGETDPNAILVQPVEL